MGGELAWQVRLIKGVLEIALQVFFLPASTGERFCVFHPVEGTPRGAVLYVHPFAEEMNKSRRMAALQSRALASRGVAVLQIDLAGCGDSSGEFCDARWETWRQDVELGVRWLSNRANARVHLWGLRLGAMLALEVATAKCTDIAGVMMWQPVVSGEQHLTQFLRLRIANEMLGSGSAASGTQSLRAELASGNAIEVAGYLLAPELVRAIDKLKLADLITPEVPIRWYEVVAQEGRSLPPAAQRTVDTCLNRGVQIEVRCVAGDTFWNTLEIAECQALLEATTAAISGDMA